MERGKLRRFLKTLVMIIALFAVGFLLQNLNVGDANAKGAYYGDCEDGQWDDEICEFMEDNPGSGVTTVWIGPVNSSSIGRTIWVDDPDDTSFAIGLWAACVGNIIYPTASGIYLDGDGGSIYNVPSSIRCGSWGSPNHKTMYMDVPEFMDGADYSYESGDREIYCRGIEINQSDEWHPGYTDVCISVPGIKYYGSSSVNGSETSVVQTDSWWTDSRDVTYWLRPRQSISMSFNHYAYSNKDTDVSWSVSRSGFTTNSNVSISPSPRSSSSGWTYMYWGRRGYYYSSVGSTSYTMTFNQVGSYGPFCERLSVDYSSVTRVCGTVYVPYNFVNTTSIDLNDSIVYAGERTTAKNLKVTVNPTYNSATGATYATVSPSTQVRVVTYTSSSNDSGRSYQVRSGAGTNLCAGFPYKNGQCAVVASTSAQSVNSGNNASGQTISPSINQTYNVYDTNAGDWFCVASAVYPYSSGSATNYSDANGSYSWYISKPVCRQVAKKPSFQIWGGSLYSNGKVKTGVSTKNNLLGVSGYGYSATGGNIRVFGSWAEVGVSSIGTVTGLASGAATGRTSDGVGGSKEGNAANYCKYRTPLSFSNYSSISTLCPNTSATGQVGTSSTKLDKNSLVDYIAKGNTPNTSGNNINLNDKNNYTETANENNTLVRYTYNNGNISLAGTTLPKGVTHVVRSTGTITVNGNIAYDNTNYTQLTEVPKLILYAENINIDCSVTRLDAIVIANKNVNTCPSTDYNSATNSRQLKINGVVIADKLYLNRTYGAATGRNSGVPAEIINYDSSTLLWTDAMTDTTSTDTMNVTYQHELAPRY